MESFEEQARASAYVDAGTPPPTPKPTFALTCAASAAACPPTSTVVLECANAADCPERERCCAGGSAPVVARCAVTCAPDETELCDPTRLSSSCANWCEAGAAQFLGLPATYGACRTAR